MDLIFWIILFALGMMVVLLGRYSPFVCLILVVFTSVVMFTVMQPLFAIIGTSTNNCYNTTTVLPTAQGQTNSFGGAGAEGQFGGFNGQLEHPEWVKTEEHCDIVYSGLQSNVTDGSSVILNEMAALSFGFPAIMIVAIFFIIFLAIFMQFWSSDCYYY